MNSNPAHSSAAVGDAAAVVSAESASAASLVSPLRLGLIGGFSGCLASLVSQPMELLKVRYQLVNELTVSHRAPPLLASIQQIHSERGIRGFYDGLSASLARQAVYSSVRFAVYHQMKQRNAFEQLASPAPAVLSAALAGLVGSIISSPLDLLLIRLQSDNRLPSSSPARRHYRNPLDGIRRIIRDEGILQLWRGLQANAMRAVVVTVAQFAIYDHLKSEIASFHPVWSSAHPFGLQLAASVLTGFCVATIASPVDLIRTRLMNNSSNSIAAYNSGNPIRAAVAIFRSEGSILSFWKGILPYYCRVGPHVTTMLISFDQINRWINQN